MKNIFIVVLLILLSGVGVFIYTNVKNNDLPSNEKVTYTNNLLGYSVVSPEIRNRLEEILQEINPKDEDGFRLANTPLMFSAEKVQERIIKTVLLEETKKYYVNESYNDTGYQEVYGLDIVVPNNNEAKQIVAKMIASLEY